MSRSAMLSVGAIVLTNRGRNGEGLKGRGCLSNRCLSLKDEWEDRRAFPVVGTLCAKGQWWRLDVVL